MPLTEWKRIEEFEEFAKRAGDGVVFKHSTSCGVSAEARQEVMRFAERNPEAPVFLVLVIESRELSAALEERLDVRHQSPQAIVLREGRAVWNASHWEVSAENLERAWTAVAEGES